MPRAPRTRDFCWTWNNYLEEDCQNIQALMDEPTNGIRYIVYGKEIGEERGTPHLQGFICFENPKTMRAVSRLLPRANLRVRRGTHKQASDYCKKGEQTHAEWDEMGADGPNWGLNADVFERGDLPGHPGRRNDITAVRDVVRTDGMRAVLEGDFGYQAAKHAELYLKYCEPEREQPPEIYWIWGESGSGKSRMAELLAGPNRYRKTEKSKWFDGYDRHPAVILDDLDHTWEIAGRGYLLTFLDRYGSRVECKGGSRQMVARRIIITCQYHPSVYEQTGGYRPGELVRRITEIREVRVARGPEVDGGNNGPRLQTCVWDERRQGFYTGLEDDATLVEND